MRPRGVVHAVCAAALSGPLLVLGTAAPAQADSDTGYRYWSFWTRDDDGAWSYAAKGPGILRPADGDVLGFRFAVSEGSEDSEDSSKPRGDADFAGICADTAAQDGRKRVALVIDPGTAADAPKGEKPPKPRTACARIPSDGTAAEALAATAKPLRYDSNSLLCAIEGYPESGCGDQVQGGGDKSADTDTGGDADAGGDAGSASGDGDGSGDGSPVAVIAGIVTVAVLAGGAMWQARRRRS